MSAQTSVSRRDRDVVSRNYETVCTKIMELGIEICRSYYVGGSDPLREKAEDIYFDSRRFIKIGGDIRGGGQLRGDSIGGDIRGGGQLRGDSIGGDIRGGGQLRGDSIGGDIRGGGQL